MFIPVLHKGKTEPMYAILPAFVEGQGLGWRTESSARNAVSELKKML